MMYDMVPDFKELSYGRWLSEGTEEKLGWRFGLLGCTGAALIWASVSRARKQRRLRM